MVVASDVALAVFGLVFASVIPGLLIYGKYRLQHRSDWLGIALSWCHPLVVSCILGAIVGNAGLNRHSKTVNDILELASEVTVGIALPLLLYSCDLRQLKTLGGRCLLVFGLGAVSVLIAASLAWLTFRSVMGHKPAADVAGLMVAVFTGGTANMAAAQVALDVDQDLFIATMTTELGIAALYIFSAITFAKPALAKLLPPFESSQEEVDPKQEKQTEADNKFGKPNPDADELVMEERDEVTEKNPADDPEMRRAETNPKFEPCSSSASDRDNSNQSASVDPECKGDPGREDFENTACNQQEHEEETKNTAVEDATIDLYIRIWNCKSIPQIAAALLVSIVIALAGVGIGMLIKDRGLSTLATVLIITTVSLLLSYVKRIRELEPAFALGQYSILIFVALIGMISNVKQVFVEAPIVVAFVAFTMVLGLALHIIAARIFSVDVDTLIVMSCSCILAPPLVPMITNAIGNNKLVVPGVIIGVLGYAVGTYLGIGTTMLWRSV
eukprot:gb/GECG01013350.1/.p1 GENE.gb/GECG01013350.1/~~gb/GECG01013350.1/.p1  ORF type:complete len:501 (+),score=34.77 gb/GECG01013350.1/:1-1503(+)